MITRLSEFRAKRAAETPEQTAARQVRAALAGRVTEQRGAQAEARAMRNVNQGLQLQVAINRAVSWALSALECDFNNAPAAAGKPEGETP